MASTDHTTVIHLIPSTLTSMNKPEKYLEDDDKLHKKLIVSCELATSEPVEADDEETESMILHEQLFAAA